MLQDLLLNIDLCAKELMKQPLYITALRQSRSLYPITENEVFGLHLEVHLNGVLGLARY